MIRVSLSESECNATSLLPYAKNFCLSMTGTSSGRLPMDSETVGKPLGNWETVNSHNLLP